jgi:hypothetical protein
MINHSTEEKKPVLVSKTVTKEILIEKPSELIKMLKN